MSTPCTSKILLISGTECIGDSWPKLNLNFQNLSADICTVSTLTNTISTNLVGLSSTTLNLSTAETPTLQLSFNRDNYTLSGLVKDGSINTTKLGGDISSNAKTFLTTVKLSSLLDIELTNIQDKQILKWDTATNKWINTFEDLLSGLIPNDIYQDIQVSSNGQVWEIVPGAVTETKILDNAVTTNKIIAQGVTTTRLQDHAVTETKLLTSLGQQAVSTPTIRDGAITTAKLDSTINTEAVTTSVIRNQAVTNEKLSAVPGLTIKGNSTNIPGIVQDISAENTGESLIVEQNGVLRRFNNTLGFGLVDNTVTTATTGNSSDTIVLRNANGIFECNSIITVNEPGLIGQALSAISANYADVADTATILQTPRTIEISGAVTGSAIFDGSSDINILTTGGGEINNVNNLGSGVEIYKEKVGTDFFFKTLSAGNNISLSAGANEIIIENTFIPAPPQTRAKAWISFNGQTGQAYSSYNVTSIQRLAKGVWYINLTPGLLSDTNYCIVTNTMQGNIPGVPPQAHGEITDNNSGDAADSANARPVSTTRVLYEAWRNNTTLEDNVYNNLVIFG